MAYGNKDYIVILNAVKGWWERKFFYGHSKDINSIVYSNDGKTVVSGSDDKTIKLWDV